MHFSAGRLSLRPRRPAPGAAPAAGWRTVPLAALWAVATGLLPLTVLVLVGWLASAAVGDVLSAVRLSADVWLAAHGATLDTATGAVSLRPLGLTLVVAALLWRAGRWVGCTSRPESLRALAWLVGSYGLGYGLLVVGVAVAAAGPLAEPHLAMAALGGTVLAGTVGGLGIVHGAAFLDDLRGRVPVTARVALDAGTGAILVLLGLSALLLAAVLVMRRGPAYELSSAVGPDAVAWPLLVLLNVVLVPNAVLFTLSYAAGPGFALGAGTAVSVGGSALGDVPPLALFAALPSAADPGLAGYLVFAIPAAAGIAAGWLSVRRSATLRPETCALAALGAGLGTGVVVGVAAWAAAGSLGDGMLATIGPSGWLVGLAIGAEVGAVAAVTAWVACPRGRLGADVREYSETTQLSRSTSSAGATGAVQPTSGALPARRAG